MAYKTDFLSQWNNVNTAIKTEMNKQLDYFGKIKLEKLNEAYHLQTQKWSSSVMYEGNWLANAQNEKFSKEFLGTLHSFKFSVIALSSKPSVIGYLASAGIGIGSFVLFKYTITLALPSSLAISAFLLILGLFLSASSNKKKTNSEKENLKALYIAQLKTVENMLVEICQKYDN